MVLLSLISLLSVFALAVSMQRQAEIFGRFGLNEMRRLALRQTGYFLLSFQFLAIILQESAARLLVTWLGLFSVNALLAALFCTLLQVLYPPPR